MINRGLFFADPKLRTLKSDYVRYQGIASQKVNHIAHILQDWKDTPVFGKATPANKAKDPIETTSLASLLNESADATTRKNQRKEFIRRLENWVKETEAFANKKVIPDIKARAQKNGAPKTDPEIQASRPPSLDEPLLPAESASGAENFAVLEEIAVYIADIQLSLGDVKKSLSLLEHAREEERYEDTTLFIMDSNNHLQVNKLQYSPQSQSYNPEREEAKGEQLIFKLVSRGLRKPDELVVYLDEKEYAALQQLGGTLEYKVNGELVDKALTAQFINIMGSALRQYLYDIVRHEMKLETFIAKENICRHMFNRLMALQDVESAYGGSIVELKKELNNYKAGIQELKNLAQTDFNTILLDGSLKPKEKKWFAKIAETFFNGLAEDLNAAETFEFEISKISAEIPTANQEIELYKKGNDPYRTGLTTWKLEEFLRYRCLSIFASGKKANDDVDKQLLISTDNIFIEWLIKAKTLCHTFEFDLHGRMTHAYQGRFKGRRVISISDLAHGKTDTRNILFAMICVKAGIHATNDIVALLTDAHPKTVWSLGWSRFNCFRRGRSNQIERINTEINRTLALNQAQFIFQAYSELRDSMHSTNETFFHAFTKVLKNFGGKVGYTAQEAAKGFVNALSSSRAKLIEDFTLFQEAKVAESVDLDSKREHEELDLEKGMEARQYTLPAFHPWHPPTLPANLADFVQHVGGVFIEKYGSAPFFWAFGTFVGAIAGGTAIDAVAMKTFLKDMYWTDEMADAFVNASIAISEASTSNHLFQVIGTATTVQQTLALLILESLANGADSTTIKALKEASRNLAAATAIIFGSVGFGKALSYISIFGDDIGTKPVIAEFFIGIKVAGIGIESVMHEPGEPSALANTATSAVHLAGDAVRAGFSFFQPVVAPIAGLTALCTGQKTASPLTKFARPWKDIARTGARAAMSVTDAGLQIGATALQAAAAAGEAIALETPFNLATAAVVAGEKAANCVVKTSTRISEGLIKTKNQLEGTIDTTVMGIQNQTTRRFRRFYEDTCRERKATHGTSVRLFGSYAQPQDVFADDEPRSSFGLKRRGVSEA